MTAKRPPKIYKYERFSVQSLRNLKAQTLFFGSPRGFNDPYDCALMANVSDPSAEQLNEVRAHYMQDEDLGSQGKRELASLSEDGFRALIVRAARSAAESQVKSFLDSKGVTCFSELADDLLMWSHYGGQYKGFCLEFDTTYEPFQKLRQVKYVDVMPSIDPVAAVLGSDVDQYLDLFCTKSSSWSYEREWRAIHQTAGTAFTYSAESLTGIYFGPDVHPEDLEIVCLILGGQNDGVQLWRGSRSDNRFRVEFEPFTYTTYLEAKRSGLRE